VRNWKKIRKKVGRPEKKGRPKGTEDPGVCQHPRVKKSRGNRGGNWGRERSFARAETLGGLNIKVPRGSGEWEEGKRPSQR